MIKSLLGSLRCESKHVLDCRAAFKFDPLGHSRAIDILKSDDDVGFSIEVLGFRQFFLDNLLGLRLVTSRRLFGEVTGEVSWDRPDIRFAEEPLGAANLLALVEEGDSPELLSVVNVVAQVDLVVLEVDLTLPVGFFHDPALV